MSPVKSKKPCAKHGCPNLTDKRYCTDHTQSGTDLYRGSAHSRGYDGDWKKLREQALKRDDYCCVLCRAQGKLIPASPVDHIIPIKQWPAGRLVLSNLQSLCKLCHDAKTRAETRNGTPYVHTTPPGRLPRTDGKHP